MIENVYVNFFDSIEKTPVEKLISICTEAILKHSPQNIHILFSSPGGNISFAFALYAYLKAVPVNIIMHGAGCIDSCAVNVFLAANTRFATKGTTFLLHASKRRIGKDSTFTIEQLHSELISLQEDQNKVINNIIANTKITKEEVAQYFYAGATLSDVKAVEKGIISEIKDFSVKPGCPFYQAENASLLNQNK